MSETVIDYKKMVTYKTLILDKLLLAIRKVMLSICLHRLTVEEVTDTISKDIVFDIKGYIYKKDHLDEVIKKEIEVPSNWKESFKERWFPKWLLRKFPIRYTTIVTETKNYIRKVCPYITVSTKDDQLCVEWLCMKSKKERKGGK